MSFPTDSSDPRVLRHVKLDDHRLLTWDTGHTHRSGPQWCVGYRLTDPDGKVIFEGEDYGCSPMHSIDADESLRGLISFLTLCPGDTDREYFNSYTPEQLAWADEHAENLSIYAEEENPVEFEDIDSCHECGADSFDGDHDEDCEKAARLSKK